MLKYFNAGERLYGEHPVTHYHRGVVEFQAILSGTAHPLPLASPHPPSITPCLWVHGPKSGHGWTDSPRARSQIIVYQFLEVSPLFLSSIGPAGQLHIPLSPTETDWIKSTYPFVVEASRRPTANKLLQLENIRATLCAIAARHLPERPLARPDSWGAIKVEQALTWYRERLLSNPSVADVARGVAVSPTHLRRLFSAVRGESPLSAFRRLRLETARGLIRGTTDTLQQIAARLGFSEPSAFSRAYRHEFGAPPSSDRPRS